MLEHAVVLEKASDPIRPIPEVDLAELNSEIADVSDFLTSQTGPTEVTQQAPASRSPLNAQPDDGTSIQ